MGPALAEIARSIGQPLMPWQQRVADVGCEVVKYDGDRPEYQGLWVPAYRDVRGTVPRQSGKTTEVLIWELSRASIWSELLGRAQNISYSAQTGNDARKKLINDQFPILRPRKNALKIRRLYEGMGNEGVLWENGSRLTLLSSKEDAGHGPVVDLGVKDEFFADVDDRRDQGLLPSMLTRPAAQLLTFSTAGTDASIPLNAAIEQGRSFVEDGVNGGVCYFEWSADPDDDPDDPETWYGCMPALGVTQDLSSVRHARMTLPDGEFRRAFLNLRTSADERIIPETVWDLICSPDAEAMAGVFGLDVNPERSAGAVFSCGKGPVLEMVDYRPGTAWLVERCIELWERYRVGFAVDPGGPAGSFVRDLEIADVKVIPVGGRELALACGAFYDAVVNEEVSIRRVVELDAAVAGATKKTSGDVWTWARKNLSVDISPLVACTVALWAATQAQPAPVELVVI